METGRQCRTDRAARLRTLRATAAIPAETALDELRLIRETMERAGSFTAVSGAAMMVVGATAVPAAWLASRWPLVSLRWFGVWSVECALALLITLVGVRAKAFRTGTPLLSGPARRALLGLLPALAAGAVLTSVLAGTRAAPSLVPGVWMLMYGVALMGAGAFSVRPVQVMGWCFAVLGVAALVMAGRHSTPMMAAAFGGFHLGFGAWIWRRYGG